MWIFKIILFLTIVASALFAFFAMGVMDSATPLLSEAGGTLGVLPSWVWVTIAVLSLGAILGLATNFINK